MFAEKAVELIKELDRNPETLPPYNNDLISEVLNEIRDLNGSNIEKSSVVAESCRNIVVDRNIRCLDAYHYNRLRCVRAMRWEFGGVLPSDVKENLSQIELEWFNKYSNNLAQYMSSVGEYGIDLTANLKPPKSLYVEVRCLTDYGKFEMKSGGSLFLKKNSRHLLPRSECEELIRQGIFKHINNM